MAHSRRHVLWLLSALAAGTCAARSNLLPQARKMPNPPDPAETDARAAGAAPNRASQRAILQQHEKEFRDSLASLLQRVNELQAEVEQLHSLDIFSAKIYKQTGEIEHLAKQLKNLAKS